MNRRSITKALVGLFLLFIISGGSAIKMKLVNTQYLDISEGEKLEISYTGAPITIYESDTDQLVLKEYMNRDNSSYFARISQSGGSTRIKRGERPFLSFLRVDVEVYLPKKYLDSISVSGVSGAIHANTFIEAGRVKIGTTSGGIKLEDCKADTVDIETTSGGITTGNITAGNSSIHTTSGGLRLGDIAGAHNFGTVSGGITVAHIEGHGRIKTTSGGIAAEYTRIDGDVDASTVSGSIRLGIPSDAGLDFKASSSTGRVRVTLDGRLDTSEHSVSGSINGGGARMQLHTTTGGITVEQR